MNVCFNKSFSLVHIHVRRYMVINQYSFMQLLCFIIFHKFFFFYSSSLLYISLVHSSHSRFYIYILYECVIAFVSVYVFMLIDCHCFVVIQKRVRERVGKGSMGVNI